MQITKSKIVFSPTDIVRFFESEFASYMDHFEKIVSKEILKNQNIHRDPTDSLKDIISEMGNSHEKEIIKNFEKQGSVIKIDRDRYDKKTCIQKTLYEMKKGADKIYQASISSDQIFGYVDILEKTKGVSELGNYHYTPCDIKISTCPMPSAIIQLCCYCDILKETQKILPEQIKIITKDKTEHNFQTKQFFYFYQFLKERFLDYHSSFDSNNIPIPNKQQDHKDWSFFAKKLLHECEDISLVANIRQSHCEKLKNQNIQTVTDLSNCSQTQIKGIVNPVFNSLKEQAVLQVSSKKKNEIQFKVLPHTEETKGLKALPPPNKWDVFFDMEGYPFLADEGLEYLYGNTINEKPEYICFWAEDKTKEAFAFKSWIDWIYDRWKHHPKMHIYHYGHYENSTIKRLMGKYGIGEFEIDNFLRNHVFVDLHRIVTQSLRVGTFSYSLKEIEKLYYKNRETYVQSGSESAVQFFYFLNSGQNKKDSPFLKKIEDYNKDDCFSTRELCKFLWKLQKTEKIKYKAFTDESIKEVKRQGWSGECEEKAKELLSYIPVEKRGLSLSDNEPGFYLSELLAYLLEFHIREDKPGWWVYFDQFKKSDEERFDDRHSIAKCKFIKNRNEKFQIKFEKEQEIGFDIGDKVFILENQDPEEFKTEDYKILELDLIKGKLYLDASNYNNIPTQTEFTLVLARNDFYKINIYKSLLETANSFSFESKYFGLKKCIYDLLLRRLPDLQGHKGSLISTEYKLIEEASEHALKLNDSILCIQGPPGSGKTYTAAHIILNLVKKGKRVGVTSNSHKAILNLLKMVCEQNKKNLKFVCEKVSKKGAKEEEKKFIENLRIELVDNASTKSDIVGGTVFFFSRSAQENAYDYLFVDEASQVSLANIVSAGRSARNIILLGDQNQLEQPIQGTHPGESGQSALTYYTNGQTTIAKDKGIFLPISYRMHLKICKFVSENFYNGKLYSDKKNSQQKIVWSPSLKKKLPDSGIYFIPIEHVGNKSASLEEVDIIYKLYQDLLQSKWINKEGNTLSITKKDILIVAPYNLQVAYLKRQLNQESARVASVDKFQGQEAPVSILSMGASSIQDAPRGVDFLLNKNRLNVAISRAKCLSIIIGSTSLLDTNISSIKNIELMNTWCRIVRNK